MNYSNSQLNQVFVTNMELTLSHVAWWDHINSYIIDLNKTFESGILVMGLN